MREEVRRLEELTSSGSFSDLKVKPRSVQKRRRAGVRPDGLVQTRIKSLFINISEGGGAKNRIIDGVEKVKGKVYKRKRVGESSASPSAKLKRITI